jgi:hypothetical protein
MSTKQTNNEPNKQEVFNDFLVYGCLGAVGCAVLVVILAGIVALVRLIR